MAQHPRPGGEPRPGSAGEPTPNDAFRVLIGGTALGVARVDGLALAGDPARLEPLSGRTGAAGWRAPPLPVRLRLARALDGDRLLYDWRRAALARPEAAVRTVAIHQLDRDRRRVLNAWTLEGWPLAWVGPAFDANDPGLAWEALEVVAPDLTWLKEAPDARDP